MHLHRSLRSVTARRESRRFSCSDCGSVFASLRRYCTQEVPSGRYLRITQLTLSHRSVPNASGSLSDPRSGSLEPPWRYWRGADVAHPVETNRPSATVRLDTARRLDVHAHSRGGDAVPPRVRRPGSTRRAPRRKDNTPYQGRAARRRVQGLSPNAQRFDFDRES